MAEESKKFSFHIFLINITSRKFWVWILSSWFVKDIILKNGDHTYFIALIIIWGVLSLVYLVGDPIEKGLGIMLENAKLTAEIKAGAQATINTDTAKVLEASKNNGGKE